MSELLKNLNPEQLAAVTHEDGPLLIVAGAGTGKTTVLINRLAYLILEKGVKTDEILLMTFTEKATSEMVERADKILPYGYVDLWINTFHSFCERVLRAHALDIGLSPDFKLLNTTEQWILLKKNLAKFDLDYYRPLGSPQKFLHELLKHFSRLKDEALTSLEYLQYAEGLEQDLDGVLSGGQGKKKKAKNGDEEELSELEVKRVKELANAYHLYNQLLLDNEALDFGDLINYTLKLFRERPQILQLYQQQFKYIMVDEFQDTNWAQFELVKILAAPSNNLLVCGDEDQSIFRFRGTSIFNILKFKEDYPTAKEVVLTKNYRSQQEILDYAYRFIQHNNPNRLEVKLKIDKRLRSQRIKENNSPAVKFFNFSTETKEISSVVEKIKEIYQSQSEVEWSDMAILVRANDTAEKYLKELRRQDIPHQFVSSRGLYYKSIILDIVAYFRLLDNYHESSALFRVLNMETFKVAYPDLININKFAHKKVWSLFEALKNVAAIPNVSPEAVANINKLLDLVAKHSALIKTEKPSKILVRLAYDSDLLKSLDRDLDREIFSYLNQFYQKIKDFENSQADLRLKDFMEMLDMEMDAGDSGSLRVDYEDADAVKVMTVHAAKGLEFKYVFVVDLVDKRFPTINRGEKISLPVALAREKIEVSKDGHLEEERRLFYVAVTRAKDELYLTSARDCGGAREKKPSRFIEELGIDNNFQDQVNAQEISDFDKDLLALGSDGQEALAADFKEMYELPEKFSFSQLAAYSVCPLQYKFAFILKVPVPMEKASLIFGRVLHDTLREFLEPLLGGNNKLQGNLFGGDNKQKIDLQNDDDKKILDIYQKHWQPDGYNFKEERDKYYQKGKDIVRAFQKDLVASTLPEIMFLEKDFSFPLGEASLKGKIDRVDKLPDGSLEIIDYKTGIPKEKLDWDDKRQLILYQLFLEDFFRLPISRLTYYYLENGRRLSFAATEKDKEKLKLEVIEQIREIKKLNFSPTPSELCRHCDFNRICEFRK